MKVILNIADNYTSFPQDFEPIPVMLTDLHRYDRRGLKGDNYKSMEDIKEMIWFPCWFDSTTDHFFEEGKAVGVTKERYYAFVIDIIDMFVFISLVANKEFHISLQKTDYVEVEYELKLS